jgi:hypothetical protein
MTSDIQEQIERRRERARAEILKIVNKGSHPVFSLFEVSSVSKKSYRVEIRSLDELQNSCTCPDYKSNLIGTCKHIEGVLISLEKEHGKKLKKLAAERPKGTQIYLHHGVDVTLRIILPIPDNARVRDLLNRHFDPSGLLVGSPLQALPTLLAEVESLSARDRSLVRVTEAVIEYLSLLQDREEVAQQKEWFLDQVKRGRRTFDVLSTKLYPYQEQGAMHLAFGRRAMLADDMGLGKTVQAIAAAALLKEMRDIQTAVVICPLRSNTSGRVRFGASPRCLSPWWKATSKPAAPSTANHPSSKSSTTNSCALTWTNCSNCIPTSSSLTKPSASKTGAQKPR